MIKIHNGWKKISLLISLVLIVSIIPFSSLISKNKNEGREIMEKMDELKKPKTSYMENTLTIYKKSKKDDDWTTKTKKFNAKMLRESDDVTKALVEFTYPTKLKLLTHSYAGKDDKQWLIRENGEKRQIEGGEKGDSFVDSHLTYEDMSELDIDDHEYESQGKEDLEYYDLKKDEDVTVECYVVKAKPKQSSSYKYRLVYVRTSDYCLIGADFYNKSGKLVKTLRRSGIKKVDGILTSEYNAIYLANGLGQSIVKMEKVKYNQKYDKKMFNPDSL